VINVQGGGSGAGITAAGQKIADIGSSSRAVKDTEMTTYPDLKTFEIGACAACFIKNVGFLPAVTTVDQKTDLLPLFTGFGPDGTTVATSANLTGAVLYSRADSSGTKDVVSSWIGSSLNTPKSITITSTAKQVPGSQGVEDAVAGDSNGVGYVDYGFTVGDTRVSVLNVWAENDVINRKVLGSGGKAVSVSSSAFSPTKTANDGGQNILSELKTDGTVAGKYYPEGLIQPLFYITSGQPNTLEQNFIDFARSPDGSAILNKDNYFGVTQYK
jgi:phosphate transport system substrate-binding protein